MQKYYANNNSIAQYQLENSIEITAEQYAQAMAAKINGQVVEVVNDELVIKELYVKVIAYLKSDCTTQKEFDDKTLVTDDYTLDVPNTRFDEWINDEWVKNLDLAFTEEMSELNAEYDKNMAILANKYNIAVARDGSQETAKVESARAEISTLDAQYESDQLAILNKYYGA